MLIGTLTKRKVILMFDPNELRNVRDSSQYVHYDVVNGELSPCAYRYASHDGDCKPVAVAKVPYVHTGFECGAL